MNSKLETFLTVVKMRSYTKAALELHLTQPAITQHIKALEEYFGASLLYFQNRRLCLTGAGEMILQYAKELEAMETMVFQKLNEIKNAQKEMTFASTLTIGEFTMEPILGKLMESFKDYKINMTLDNTQSILGKLKEGAVSFALIEGLFDVGDLDLKKLKDCDYILVTKKDHALTKKDQVCIKDLLGERLIVREKGSGSREVLEMGLRERNQSLLGFKEVMELGNVNLMKRLVERGLGISLMYKDAALKELREGTLVEVPLVDLKMTRGFYFVSLKNKQFHEEKEMFFQFFKREMEINEHIF